MARAGDVLHLNPEYRDGRTADAVDALETDRHYRGIDYGVVNLNIGRAILSPGRHGRLVRTHAVVRWPGTGGVPLRQRSSDQFDLVRFGGMPEDAPRDLRILTELVLDAAVDPISRRFALQWTKEARQRFEMRHGAAAEVMAGMECTMAPAPLGAIVVGEISEAGPADGARHARLWFPAFVTPELALAQMQHLSQPDFASPSDA